VGCRAGDINRFFEGLFRVVFVGSEETGKIFIVTDFPALFWAREGGSLFKGITFVARGDFKGNDL
jgi:hypothetical protein